MLTVSSQLNGLTSNISDKRTVKEKLESRNPEVLKDEKVKSSLL